MSISKMSEVANIGQSLWIDNISRSMIVSGQLKSMIDKGLRGQTSNPTIFKQAISTSNDYDKRIVSLTTQGKTVFEVYDALTITDVQDAADLFRCVYDTTKGLDGYVSLEINPQLANEYASQLAEGARLWKTLNRPNVMIKVPATKNGVKVFESLIGQGINVNVTLIFSAEQYSDVARAYMNGLKILLEKKGDVSKVRSVASVFVSRLDTAIDKWLDDHQHSALRGKAAVANAEIIYHKYSKEFATDEFKVLQKSGAHDQRVLWASTGTKDVAYSDVKYITELIAKNTVNTVPDKTLDAFCDHGTVKIALPADVSKAQLHVETLRKLGIDPNVVCLKLLEDGLVAFDKSFEELLASIETKSQALANS